MKICHVVASLQPEHGGPSKSVYALAQALARAGHSVQLLATAPDAPKSGHAETHGNLQVTVFRREWPQRLCLSSGLRDALRRSDADIIHHHALWLRTLHYAHRAARRGAPLVTSPRGMMSRWAWQHHHWRKAASRLLVHPGAFAAVAGWHATSPEEAAEIRALGFRQPVCVAPNGVDEPMAASVTESEAFWHAACPEVVSRPTAVFYSRFHQKKRVIELIDVWLERAPADWLLLLVGLPEDYTPARLNEYVQNQSAAGRVRAFDGAGKPPPYSIASLFVLPSHNENFGLAVAEAMAHGVAPVVTNTTPWTAVNTLQCGWCVAWEQFGDALARATRETTSQLKERGERARQWVLREYSWDRAAEALVQFYGDLRPH